MSYSPSSSSSNSPSSSAVASWYCWYSPPAVAKGITAPCRTRPPPHRIRPPLRPWHPGTAGTRPLPWQKASRRHVVLALLLVEFALLFGRGVLVLLVLGNEIVHVRFRFREFHLVHTFASVPMKERLAAKHRRE